MKGSSDVVPSYGLTQVKLQHGTSLTHFPTASVLIEDPAIPLVVDRHAAGSSGCDLPRLTASVRDCRVWNPTGSRCIATFETWHMQAEIKPQEQNKKKESALVNSRG